MNGFELLQKWPSWEKASAESIFDSPAWAMPVRWGDAQCIMRRADVKFRDVLGIAIRLDDEENFIGLGRRESFKDLNVLWDVKNNLPDALKLALVERECGALFQIIENAARRQLTVVNVAPSEKREGATGFEVVTAEGRILASFDLKVTASIIRAFGLIKFIDVNHECIRSMKRTARAVYSSFTLTDAERAGLIPGDCIMMPEIGSVPPKWQFETPKDGLMQICAPETTELTFAQFADDQLPEIPMPEVLTLMMDGKSIANGRLTKLAELPAFAIEEII